jgi:hypothetical protein
LEGFTPSISHTDLKAFTMAAMQGLCSNGDMMPLAAEEIAHDAIFIARATLAELSKQQQL